MSTLVVLASALAIQAATPAPQTPPTAVDDVVVSARPLEQQVRSFLDDLTTPEANLRIARFQNNICVGAVNMRGQTAQYVVDRISQIGLDIGLEPGEPGCSPNILVIASQDGTALAESMVQARPVVFRPGGSQMNRNRNALARFQESDAAIRWWHVSVPMDNHTGQIAVRLPGDEDAPFTTGSAARLRTEIRNDISRVIVILDFNKLEGLNMTQVADFAAMVSFSQVDLDGDFSAYDSILALPSDKTQTGITEWDLAYLRALYSAELTATQKSQQIGEIARLMQTREVTRE